MDESPQIVWFTLTDKGVVESVDEAESIGAKLQSYGLAANSPNLAGNRNSFAILQKGRDFLEYIRTAAADEVEAK